MEKALKLASCLYGLLILLSLAMVAFLSQFPFLLPLLIPLMVGLVVCEAVRAVVPKKR